MSNALKQKRKKNFGTGEDYGTKLPDEEVNAKRANKLEDSDDDVIIGDCDEHHDHPKTLKDALFGANKIIKNIQSGKKTNIGKFDQSAVSQSVAVEPSKTKAIIGRVWSKFVKKDSAVMDMKA